MNEDLKIQSKMSEIIDCLGMSSLFNLALLLATLIEDIGNRRMLSSSFE